MKEKIDFYIKEHDLKKCETLFMSLDEKERLSKTMMVFSIILKIARIEEDNGIKGVLWRDDCETMDKLIKFYYKIKYYLRRIEYDIELDSDDELVELNISKYMLLMMISLFSINKRKVVIYIMKYFKGVGNGEIEEVLYKFLTETEILAGGN